MTAGTSSAATTDRRWPSPWLIALAAVGGIFLIVVAVNRWATPSDEHAYWLAARRLLAGESLYDPSATPITPYAYWYPPVFAQVLVPVAALLPAMAFTVLWTFFMLGCLWWLAGRDVLVALALLAFPPVAVEFWFRNVHLVLAVLIVLGLRRWSGWFSVGGAIKLAPAVGVIYLLVSGAWKAAAIAVATGLTILAVSVALSPSAWAEYIDVLAARGPSDASGFVAIPFAIRAVVGVGLAIFAARIRSRWREPLLVVAIVVSLPTLWVTALSALVAVVPLLRTRAAG